MSSKSFWVELEVSSSSIGEALADLRPEQMTQVLSIADEHNQEWDFILAIHKWVIPRHREWAQENVDEERNVTGHCVQSSYYQDIQSHTDPHQECILR